jgi:hypothetical protein
MPMGTNKTDHGAAVHTPPARSTEALINDPAFSHTRAGTGCWRDVRWIYHRDPNSPTGVILAGSTDEEELAKLWEQGVIRRNASPLSPTEHR